MEDVGKVLVRPATLVDSGPLNGKKLMVVEGDPADRLREVRQWGRAPVEGIFVLAEKLRYLDDVETETGNPFGEFVSSDRVLDDGVEAVWAEYKNAVSLDIRDIGGRTPRTIYTAVIFGRNDEVLRVIREAVDEMATPEDLAFVFEELR